jgi:hypothetical protein
MVAWKCLRSEEISPGADGSCIADPDPAELMHMQALAPRAKLVLRSSHRRVRLGTSHRDVPSSAWSPRSKDNAPGPAGKPGKR